jgi:hypothetical protein
MCSVVGFYIKIFLIPQTASYISYMAIGILRVLQLSMQICLHHDIFVLLIMFNMYVNFSLACACT